MTRAMKTRNKSQNKISQSDSARLKLTGNDWWGLYSHKIYTKTTYPSLVVFLEHFKKHDTLYMCNVPTGVLHCPMFSISKIDFVRASSVYFHVNNIGTTNPECKSITPEQASIIEHNNKVREVELIISNPGETKKTYTMAQYFFAKERDAEKFIKNHISATWGW